jgi:hypothetical protein
MRLNRLLVCLAIATAFSPCAMARSFDGSSQADAGLSAAQILRDHPTSTTGVYWIDLDGAGGAAPMQIFADMTVAGGGWMLVRHATNTGGWIDVTDNLGGTASLNVGFSNQPLAPVDWTIPFGTVAGSFLFKTGDDSSWGVLSSESVYQFTPGDTFAPNATVLASFNTPIAAGGMTNVLNRNGTGTGGPEDPWIGFAGSHIDNIGQMMYGENAFGGAHASFKNAHGGVNVFVRELQVPSLPVPEPGSAWLLLAGAAALALWAGRRQTGQPG